MGRADKKEMKNKEEIKARLEHLEEGKRWCVRRKFYATAGSYEAQARALKWVLGEDRVP